MEEYVADFEELSKEDISIAGGKGANLGEMFDKFPIPPGFVVLASAYKSFIKANHLGEKIQKILENTDVEKTDELNKACEKIQNMIKKGDVPIKIKRSIKDRYEDMKVSGEEYSQMSEGAKDYVKMGRNYPFVAIRSSATAEDLPSISAEDSVLIKVNGSPKFGKMKEIGVINCKRNSVKVPAMQNGEIEWKEVNQIYKYPAQNEKLYEITTRSGRKITVSSDHSLITLDENNLEPKTAKIEDLEGDEKIPVMMKLPEIGKESKKIDVLDYIKGEDVAETDEGIMIKNSSNNWKIQNPLPKEIEVSEDLAYFLGIYISEGSTYSNNCVIITNSDPKIRKEVVKFMEKIGLWKGQKINKDSYRFYCKALVRFLHKVAGKPLEKKRGKGKISKNKKVPDFVFGWKKKLIGEFFKGCFDGDGSVYEGKSINYCSTSERLIEGLLKLLEILNLEYSTRKREGEEDWSDSYRIRIPAREAKKFKKLVGFKSQKKSKSLNRLIEDYESKKLHPEFIGSIEVSDQLSEKIHNRFKEKLSKEEVKVSICPLCGREIPKNGKEDGKQKWYCSNCGKIFYRDQIEFKKEIRYQVRDEKGRFIKNRVPWNKSKISGVYSQKKFNRLMKKYGLPEFRFSKSVRWEEIDKIEPIEYSGEVYDFCVPGVENFAAGKGGVITHNSASFAGQFETFLNIKGSEDLIKAVKSSWASLFTSRGVYYRENHGFPHEKVYMATIVQRMVNASKAGVVFTMHPSTGEKDKILIEAGHGLGDPIVAGEIKPDHYVVSKKNWEILDKKMYTQKRMKVRDRRTGKTVWKDVPGDKKKKQVLPDNRIVKLAKISDRIEEHYDNEPQDIEWAAERGKLFILQSRPITATGKLEAGAGEAEGEMGEKILEGLGASPGIASGKVKTVEDLKDLDLVEKGDVLVTEMTDPDMVPAMKRAAAIVTDEGGLTSHASIVSRELGIPCIVGTKEATKVLNNEDVITVNARRGIVFKGGKVEEGVEKAEKKEIKTQKIQEKVEVKGGKSLVTATKLYTNLSEAELADRISQKSVDGVGLMRAEFLAASLEEHPKSLLEKGGKDEFIEKFTNGIRKVAKAFYPKPVKYRALDLKSNEYRDLKGGKQYEPQENNPMLGWRGASRYTSKDYKDVFKLELESIRRVVEKYELKNVELMIPFVRNIKEMKEVIKIVKEAGLGSIKLGMMVEVPSNVILADKFAELDIDFISIGTNDLTQLTLGVDRDSAKLAPYFDERDEAVKRSLERTIEEFKSKDIETSICGQAPSNYPEIVRLLVKLGIDSISVNPDAIETTREIIAREERKLLLDAARKLEKKEN